MDSRAFSVMGARPELQRLQKHAERAFVEVQRADTKATALCGVAGGLLAFEAAALSGVGSVPRLVVISSVLVCALLVAAVGAALLALRPVVPASGLDAELIGEAALHDGDTVVQDESVERRGEAHRFRVLARLADRKLRSVRVAVDLVLAALLVAGMGLLSSYAFN